MSSADEEQPQTLFMTPSYKEGSRVTLTMTEENCSDAHSGVTIVNDDNTNHKNWFGCKNRRPHHGSVSFWIFALVTVFLVAGGTLTAVIMMSSDKSSTNTAINEKPQEDSQSEEYYQKRYEIFRPMVGKTSSSSTLFQSNTPQSKALDWMVYHDTTIPHEALSTSSTDDVTTQFIQRYTIMVVFYACGGEDWEGFTSSNLEQQGQLDTCLWDGDGKAIISCNDRKEIVELKLDSRRLIGQLPEEIRTLTSLETLDVSYNFLEGPLPKNLFEEMTNLSKLLDV
jgi:hypothetical protein